MFKLAIAGLALIVAAPALAEPPTHARQSNGHGYQSQSYDSQGHDYVPPQGHGRSYGYSQGQTHRSYRNGYSDYGYDGYDGYASNRHARQDYRREVRHARRDARRYNEHGYNH
jgi:hypothetical protein